MSRRAASVAFITLSNITNTNDLEQSANNSSKSKSGIQSVLNIKNDVIE